MAEGKEDTFEEKFDGLALDAGAEGKSGEGKVADGNGAAASGGSGNGAGAEAAAGGALDDVDIPLDDKIMHEAITYCCSQDFIEPFEKYIKKHAPMFIDSVEGKSAGEHSLEYTKCFNDYLVLYENTMDDWVSSKGWTMSQFHGALDKAQDEGDEVQKWFISLLLASAEYQAFYEVMAREAQRQRAAGLI